MLDKSTNPVKTNQQEVLLMKNTNPIVIYYILLFSMLTLLISMDVFIGNPLLTVLRRSYFSFFRYVDKVEHFLVIALLSYPFVMFIWSVWVNKKQKA
jgi:hypothetical protein